MLSVGVLALPAVAMVGRGARAARQGSLGREPKAEWDDGWLVAAACLVPPVATSPHPGVVLAGIGGLVLAAAVHELLTKAHQGVLPTWAAFLLMLPAIAVSLWAGSLWPAVAVAIALGTRYGIRAWRLAPAR